MSLSITFDLEDNRRDPSQPPRFVAMTERFLDVPRRASGSRPPSSSSASWPARTRSWSGASPPVGTRSGCTGFATSPSATSAQGNLREELREGKALLEDAAQVPVPGFRAPIFSLTPRTAWALDDLAAAGFTYSSSVLPAANPLHGWPGAPRGAVPLGATG